MSTKWILNLALSDDLLLISKSNKPVWPVFYTNFTMFYGGLGN